MPDIASARRIIAIISWHLFNKCNHSKGEKWQIKIGENIQ